VGRRLCGSATMPVTTIPGRGRLVKTDHLEEPAHRQSARLTKLATAVTRLGRAQPRLGSGRTRRRLPAPGTQRITALSARSLPGPSRLNGRPYRCLSARLSKGFPHRWQCGNGRPDSGEVVFLCIANARVNFRSRWGSTSQDLRVRSHLLTINLGRTARLPTVPIRPRWQRLFRHFESA
jgi:hypothetical protein